MDGGKLVFLEENQCVVFWGVEASRSPDDDPPVYQGPNVRGRADRMVSGARDLLRVPARDAPLAGRLGRLRAHRRVGRHARGLERFLAGWTPAGRVNELRAYNREGGAACVLEGEVTSQLYVGGWTGRDFEAIEAELEAAGVEIDHF